MSEVDMSASDKERGAAAVRQAQQAKDEANTKHRDTEVPPAHPVVRTGGRHGGLTSG